MQFQLNSLCRLEEPTYSAVIAAGILVPLCPHLGVLEHPSQQSFFVLLKRSRQLLGLRDFIGQPGQFSPSWNILPIDSAAQT